jgi:hypothetical protein
MASTRVFSLRFLVKNILLFCGLEERAQLKYVSSVVNREYNGVVPNLDEVRRLIGDKIIATYEINLTQASPLVSKNSYIGRYYINLMEDVKVGNCYYTNNGLCVFRLSIPVYASIELIMYDDYIEVLSYVGMRQSELRFKSSVISVLNNLPILIKKRSLLLYDLKC